MARDESLPRDEADTPWICHVCNKSFRGEGAVCEVCFRTTCREHLRRTTVYNRESGLYEFTSVCLSCAMEEIL